MMSPGLLSLNHCLINALTCRRAYYYFNAQLKTVMFKYDYHKSRTNICLRLIIHQSTHTTIGDESLFTINMDDLGKQALTFAANLSIPTVCPHNSFISPSKFLRKILTVIRLVQFQVIVVTANLGCSHCRLRVTQVISKMAGR